MNLKDADRPYVGGQAVIEGVMMRSPKCLAIAVRRADGSIVIRDDAWVSIWERLRFLRWPFLRGAVILTESIYNGVQAIHFAAQQAERDAASEAEAEPKADPAKRFEGKGRVTASAVGMDTAPDRAPDTESEPAQHARPAEPGPTTSNTAMTIAISFVLAIALFVGLPHLLALLAGKIAGENLGVDSFAFHALDGFFKILIFVAYIGGIGLIPEIRRVFEYHGAEHKVVNVYEGGLELTLDNARSQTTFHARCGTSFVLFVLVLSIFIFAAVFPLIPTVSSSSVVNHLAMIIIKIPLMLPLAGLAYEINRFASAHPHQLWVQAIVQPGRLMQKLTTREPADDQLEIALAAMGAALRREAAAATESVREVSERDSPAQILVFRDYTEAASVLHAGA
ncbi:MAG: DUF1385 domain-containing protein [Deltaproteobacteria bacterium]|nr:DUF1385 domain-containing protein [Deltaproteobacteria bacterium]